MKYTVQVARAVTFYAVVEIDDAESEREARREARRIVAQQPDVWCDAKNGPVRVVDVQRATR